MRANLLATPTTHTASSALTATLATGGPTWTRSSLWDRVVGVVGHPDMLCTVGCLVAGFEGQAIPQAAWRNANCERRTAWVWRCGGDDAPTGGEPDDSVAVAVRRDGVLASTTWQAPPRALFYGKYLYQVPETSSSNTR